MESEALVLVFAEGAIVRIIKEEAETVGQFDCGVEAASWNPNQE